MHIDPTGRFVIEWLMSLADFIAPGSAERAQKVMNDFNAYNVINWLTLGFADTVKGAVAPEEPLSYQHWMDSLNVVSTLYLLYSGANNLLGKNAQPTNPGYNFGGAKGLDYVAKRGWTDDMINMAISNGKKGTSVNMANGASCTVYCYPGTTNQYIVIEDISRNIVQVSDFLDLDWIPDSRIIWDP